MHQAHRKNLLPVLPLPQDAEIQKWKYIESVYMRAHKDYGLQRPVLLALRELTTQEFWKQLQTEKESGFFDWGLSTLDNALCCMTPSPYIERKIRHELCALFPRFANMTYEEFNTLEQVG
jgi:hypothetical protein